MSFAAHRRRLEKLKGGDVSIDEVFVETHKKRKRDGTRGEWVEPRAEKTYEGFQKGVEEWRQTNPASENSSTIQPSQDDITSIWTEVAGGVKKGRVYGLGVQPSLYEPASLLSGAPTSQTLEEMEAMRKQIAQLTQRCETSDANFAKLQKLIKKHMPECDEEEETESD